MRPQQLRRRLRNWLLAVAVVALGGCAATGLRPALESSSVERQVELAATPFYPQEKYQCGPAALATSLGAIGIEAAPDKLVDEVYVPARKGSFQIEMLAAARRNGAVAFVLPDRIDALLAELAAGNPVLVLLNLGLSWIPSWHYAVAIGYDLDRGEIVLRSGTTARQVMSLNTFMHTWNRSERWAFVALPPGKLAVSADEQATQDATLAFARLATTANARSAYYAALQRWPDNLPLAIGLGNAAYESGDLDGARQAFEAASKTHPEDGAILNNLAFILAKQGHIAAARRTARQALALGDRWRQEAQKTLDQIESMTNAPGEGPKPKKQP